MENETASDVVGSGKKNVINIFNKKSIYKTNNKSKIKSKLDHSLNKNIRNNESRRIREENERLLERL
jgi:hypothetical protein